MRARTLPRLTSVILIAFIAAYRSGHGFTRSLDLRRADPFGELASSLGRGARELAVSQRAVPFRMPARLGLATLNRESVAGDTATWSYTAPGTTALHVSAYPMSKPASTGERVDLALRHQTDVRKGSFAALVGAGILDDYMVAFDADQQVVIAHDTVPGRVVATAFARGGLRYVSFAYVYALKGMFLSVLLTVPERGWSANKALEFPRLLVSELMHADAKSRLPPFASNPDP